MGSSSNKPVVVFNLKCKASEKHHSLVKNSDKYFWIYYDSGWNELTRMEVYVDSKNFKTDNDIHEFLIVPAGNKEFAKPVTVEDLKFNATHDLSIRHASNSAAFSKNFRISTAAKYI
jgi:hypothetical protein